MHRYKVGALAADTGYLGIPGRMTSPEPGYERGRLLFVWGLHRPITALIVLRVTLCPVSTAKRFSILLEYLPRRGLDIDYCHRIRPDMQVHA